MRHIRRFFLTGLLILLPLVITIYIIFFIFSLVDNLLAGFIRMIVGYPLPGLGVVLTILLVLIVGLIATNIIGKKFIEFFEACLNKIPLVKTIYGAVKQIIDAFSLQKNNAFQRVALVEYPRRGIYAIGFITGECSGEVQEKTAEEVINVFVPTTPNPTSGMLLLLPKRDVIPLEMSVEDGLKLLISGGVVVPKERAANGQEVTEK
ncbi:DUF502 domain-containing protein [Desulfitibacter alkalitolerans]|uniref:DUF502 domain-containing protein n=1 Tax=Desulfitibacter alkalitolerans TaxID=264641 RepID=UPI000558276F|nr:DUF502 domain-containing protein [Desulfitibacter alkalitolerans]